jgi:hypothetical protein
MMRSKGLWLLLCVLLVGAALLLFLTTQDPTGLHDVGAPIADGEGGGELVAVLEGGELGPLAATTASPYAEETDWRRLLAAVGPSHPVGALERLVAICKTDPALVRQLVDLLHPRNAQVPASAQSAVTNQSLAMVELPSDPPVSVWRTYIIDVLVAVGAPAVPALAEVLADDNEEYREQVGGALARIGPAAAGAGEALMGRIQEITLDPRHRATLLRTLAAIGAAPNGFREQLHRLLRADDTQEDLESAAAAALVRLGQVDTRTIETLSMVLRGEYLRVRMQVIHDIPELGEAAVPLVDDLIAILDRERDEELHSAVIEALATLGQADPRVIERLRTEVADPEVHTSTRWADAFALARMGSTGRSALRDALARSPETVEATVVLRALGSADTPPAELWDVAKPYLLAETGTKLAEELRGDALAVLWGQPLPAEAWAVLQPLLSSKEENVSSMALGSLYYLESIPDEARTLIEADRARPEPRVLVGGVKLANVQAPWLRELIYKETRHEDERRRNGVLGALSQASDAQLPRVLPLLARALEDTQFVRSGAIGALGLLGRRSVAAKRVREILLGFARELEVQAPEAGTPDARALGHARSVLWQLRQLGGST